MSFIFKYALNNVTDASSLVFQLQRIHPIPFITPATMYITQQIYKLLNLFTLQTTIWIFIPKHLVHYKPPWSIQLSGKLETVQKLQFYYTIKIRKLFEVAPLPSNIDFAYALVVFLYLVQLLWRNILQFSNSVF